MSTSLFPVFLHRTEFKAYRDVKPVKMIRAKSQYLPPDEKTSLETSYSATFKAQFPLQPADNKAVERRRIRSLYSEPYIDPGKQVRAHLPNFSSNKSRDRNETCDVDVQSLPWSSHCTPLRHVSSGFSFPLSTILRLTGIVSLALNPKSLEPQQQARASQWRNPKISRALCWGAPRRRPQRTSPRTGLRWGTRRKVKRWTTNWLRQKSKNHLALLLLFFLIFGEKRTQRLQNWFSHRFSSVSPSSPSLFLILFLSALSLPPGHTVTVTLE